MVVVISVIAHVPNKNHWSSKALQGTGPGSLPSKGGIPRHTPSNPSPPGSSACLGEVSILRTSIMASNIPITLGTKGDGKAVTSSGGAGA